ncbi:MAG: glycosyl hydrolase, partial [Bacteroidota bacterium]|nr:glycosyl hydrolase [Bacteroidota bacterium]
KITGLPSNLTSAQLASAIRLPSTAQLKIVNKNNNGAAAIEPVTSGYKIQVTAENGNKGYYSLEFGADTIAHEKYTDYKTTINTLFNRIWELYGKSEIRINGSSNPISGSVLNLHDANVWLYFDSIKPQVIKDKYLGQILIDGDIAVVDSNIRLVQYYNGSVLISQSSSFQPLTVYSAENITGSSMSLGLYTIYGSSLLDTFNDNVRSFVLKKGYMATFAMNEDGTGYSKVYIACDSDLVIKKLPAGLYAQTSFIRVFPWRWVTKKGWCGGSKNAAEGLHCSWQYDWDNVSTSTNNVEYIPMRHNRWWNSYDNINNKKNSTHALGFNEPDKSDQANMSLADMMAAWPNLMKSGLRLGSPCPSDGGLNLLYSFIDSCDKVNFRVDFVAMHYYLGGQTAQQFYNRLKAIHDRTKRPLWITEWNNGANWTDASSGKPTYEQQAEKISQFTYMLDTTSFVERYSIYEWVEDTRQMYYSNSMIPTPAGKVYRDVVSPIAYHPAIAYSPDYIPLSSPSTGIETIAENEKDLIVYPNPAIDYIHIQGINDAKANDVSIYNIMGEKIISGDSDKPLNVSHIFDGMYILKVKGYKSKQFLKK